MSTIQAEKGQKLINQEINGMIVAGTTKFGTEVSTVAEMISGIEEDSAEGEVEVREKSMDMEETEAAEEDFEEDEVASKVTIATVLMIEEEDSEGEDRSAEVSTTETNATTSAGQIADAVTGHQEMTEQVSTAKTAKAHSIYRMTEVALVREMTLTTSMVKIIAAQTVDSRVTAIVLAIGVVAAEAAAASAAKVREIHFTDKMNAKTLAGEVATAGPSGRRITATISEHFLPDKMITGVLRVIASTVGLPTILKASTTKVDTAVGLNPPLIGDKVKVTPISRKTTDMEAEEVDREGVDAADTTGEDVTMATSEAEVESEAEVVVETSTKDQIVKITAGTLEMNPHLHKEFLRDAMKIRLTVGLVDPRLTT